MNETDVTALRDPGLRAILESGRYHSPENKDLCLVLQLFNVPNAFVQSAKGKTCL